MWLRVFFSWVFVFVKLATLKGSCFIVNPLLEKSVFLRLNRKANNLVYLSSIALRDGISEGDLAGFQIQFRFGGRAKHTGTPIIEFAFPSRDHDRRQSNCQSRLRRCAPYPSIHRPRK